MRPGGAAEQSKVIRPLVYLWVAQNVMLVISSILRLDLYVQTYLLTYWRVAAFIWMLLVAAGLLFIVAQHRAGPFQRMAGPDEPDHTHGDTICMRAGQLYRHHRRL